MLQPCPVPGASFVPSPLSPAPCSASRARGPSPGRACPRPCLCWRRPSAIGDNKVLEPTALSCAARGGATPTGTSRQRTRQMVAKGWQQLWGAEPFIHFPCSTGQPQLKLSLGHVNFHPTVSRMFLCCRCIKIIKLYGVLECITAIRKSQKMTRFSHFIFVSFNLRSLCFNSTINHGVQCKNRTSSLSKHSGEEVISVPSGMKFFFCLI